MQNLSVPQTDMPLSRYWPVIIKHASPNLLREIEEWARVDMYAKCISENYAALRRVRNKINKLLTDASSKLEKDGKGIDSHFESNNTQKEENDTEEKISDVHSTGQVLVNDDEVGAIDNLDKLLRSVS